MIITTGEFRAFKVDSHECTIDKATGISPRFAYVVHCNCGWQSHVSSEGQAEIAVMNHKEANNVRR